MEQKELYLEKYVYISMMLAMGLAALLGFTCIEKEAQAENTDGG